jgi:hypothetical protein
VPFAYIAGAGVALVQVTDKPSIALRITLITIAGVGGFAVWHLSYLYRAARRAFDAIRDVEAKLSLPPTATNWTPEHLVALLTLTISTALGSLLSGLYLFLCGR